MSRIKTILAQWIIDVALAGLVDEIAAQLAAGEGPHYDYASAKLAETDQAQV